MEVKEEANGLLCILKLPSVESSEAPTDIQINSSASGFQGVYDNPEQIREKSIVTIDSDTDSDSLIPVIESVVKEERTERLVVSLKNYIFHFIRWYVVHCEKNNGSSQIKQSVRVDFIELL